MQLRRCLFIFVSSIIYCEFLGDFFALVPCSWPAPRTNHYHNVNKDLHVMIIADTHLLGPIRGHWLDKLYREWHMRRSFQAALLLHKPDVVFFLGDLFDEGDIVDHEDFNEFVRRFRSHFHTPISIRVISAVGNHDVGFHYRMHPYFIDRFERQFNNTGVQMYTIQDNHFIVINSMALEGDGCEFCESAIMDLRNIAGKLNCLKKPKTCTDTAAIETHNRFSRPIVLQHFPTYQVSGGQSCIEHDFPHIEQYREKWEVLSKNSTDWLGKLLRPRAAFAGHSHHFCHFTNRWGIDEYTVASFSWRNKINPSFLMASVNPSSHSVFKCNMLKQETVFNTYAVAAIICAALIMWDLFDWTRKKNFKTKYSIKIH